MDFEEGSSPHAWGPPPPGSAWVRPRGIIPTRVGTTRILSKPCAARWDHPHTRGDHPHWESAGNATADHPHTRGDHPEVRFFGKVVGGSSPHAWGPRNGPSGHPREAGIIPTRVGTTSAAARPRWTTGDHPHTRGDHMRTVSFTTRGLGSSPHAWGPRDVPGHLLARGGIIPTRVGTTSNRGSEKSLSKDHPHTRGDHQISEKSVSLRSGSSPHAWGPPAMRAGARPQGGIIPTRVGTTPSTARRRIPCGDHPHTRGDHQCMDVAKLGRRGSSPHAWGPHVVVRLVLVFVGIIPTRVGTTWSRCRRTSWRRDHPHTRGDHSYSFDLRESAVGSSPHAWGPQFSTCYLTIRLAVSASLCHKNSPTARQNTPSQYVASPHCAQPIRTSGFYVVCLRCSSPSEELRTASSPRFQQDV